MISAVIERCVGIDVGKKFLSACVMIGSADGEAKHVTRPFGTTVGELQMLREWVEEKGCTHAVMESTGSYWKPVFNVLEGSVHVALANPHEVKARKGHKTDPKDAWWLAHLLRHAMITPSFIPPRPQRELRDLTRRRKRMIQAATSEKNRVEKTLEDANVKLGTVLSDVFGTSGQLMLDALLQGRSDAAAIAEFAKKKARKRIPEIIAALEEHRMNDHHRKMIRYSLEHLKFLEEQIAELDRDILQKIEEAGYTRQRELLQTVPGVQETTAAVILAEMGPSTRQFADEKHLSSWAGLCPGNNRSAGKNKSSHTTQGNRWLRAALTECAWGAAKKKGCHLKEKFWRIAAKNKAKAVVATAHQILVLSYFVLQRGTAYQEVRGVEMIESQRQRLIRHHVKRLGKLGVRLHVAAVTAKEPRSGRARNTETGKIAKLRKEPSPNNEHFEETSD
jgi:transposase